MGCDSSNTIGQNKQNINVQEQALIINDNQQQILKINPNQTGKQIHQSNQKILTRKDQNVPQMPNIKQIKITSPQPNGIDRIKQQFSHYRDIMQLNLNKNDNFINHHLKHQLSLSKYARASLIKRRQILQHNRYAQVLNRGYGNKVNIFNQYAIKSYFQRVMLQIFQSAHQEFFEQEKSYDQVRQRIAQKYLLQMYQNKQFMDAGMEKYVQIIPSSQLSMSMTAMASDSALFPVLRFLKQKYPQVADKSQIQFPKVKQMKNDVNLLQNFASKCYSSPNFINIQTLFSDLKFLIDRSAEDFQNFQRDMKVILGQDVLTDSKVKRIMKNGMFEYSASPVRRVFIKWVQTILERIPDLILSEAFLEFLKSKPIIADNFYFKSTLQVTTHGRVIQFLCQLLEAAKYHITTLIERKQFGFYIYDLLRCKTKRKSAQQICELLNKMESTKVTASGKRFQVVRIKNRFKTANRDLMVNFRYGDVIVAEAQLCIDASHVSEKIKKTNKFNHYIYELQRGLFGPTCQLIMQYEDFQRTDILANLQAQGIVKKRVAKQPLKFLKRTDIKCFNNHDMIEMKGNHFIADDEGNRYEQLNFTCDYCQAVFSSNLPYNYCYFCTISFCTSCTERYKKQNSQQVKLRCNAENVLRTLKSEKELDQCMSQNPIIIFSLSESTPSSMFKDTIVYLMSAYTMQKTRLPCIYEYCCDSKDTDSICNKYKIKQFPTTIVFSSDGTPQTTMVGSSWSLLQGLFLTQQNLKSGSPKALDLVIFYHYINQMCWCGKQCLQTAAQGKEDLFCINCGNYCEKGEEDQKLFQASSNVQARQVLKCQNNHYKCWNCGFLASHSPSKFIDWRGKSYLCSKKQSIKVQKCGKGHTILHIKQLKIQKSYFGCILCSRTCLFNDDLGVGYCKQCNGYCCTKCLQIQQSSFKENQQQLVCHTAQSTVQQGERCICKRLFKKVYNTRDYTNSETDTQTIYKNIFQHKSREWTCMICQIPKQDGQLHLACYYCPSFRQNAINLEICIECAIGSKILMNSSHKQIKNSHLKQQLDHLSKNQNQNQNKNQNQNQHKQLNNQNNQDNQNNQNKQQIETTLVCQSNHSVIKTKLSYSNQYQQTTFQCCQCKKIYYIHTERYYCKSCKINVCLDCETKQLKQANPISYERKCPEGDEHKMIVKKVKQLKLCSVCNTVIKKQVYTCALDYYDSMCNFCLNCAQTSTKDDPSKQELRKKYFENQQVAKQLQIYRKGWFGIVQQQMH